MNIKRITAIVPLDSLQSMEKYMRECGVPGVTVETVQGYGEHPNYFRKDLMKKNAKLTLYTVEEKVDGIIEAMSACAHEHGLRSNATMLYGHVENTAHRIDHLLGNLIKVHQVRFALLTLRLLVAAAVDRRLIQSPARSMVGG